MSSLHPGALTIAWTGQLPFVLIVAALLALAASLYLLRRYRRAVTKSMRRRERGGLATPRGYLPPEEPQPPPEGALVFTFVDTEGLEPGALEKNRLYRRLRRRAWSAAAIYAAAGIAFATIMAAAFLLSFKLELLSLRLLYLVWVHGWPVVLTTVLVAIISRRTEIVLAFAYVATGAVLVILSLWRPPALTASQLADLWLNANLIPSVLLLFFLNRRIRAVGPLLLIFLIVGSAGAILLVSLAWNHPKLLRAIGDFMSSLGLESGRMVWALHLLGFAVFSLAGWVVLDSIRQLYERKVASDQSIIVASIWLTFGIVNSMAMALQEPRWIAAGFVAFAAFKTVAGAGFAFLRRNLACDAPRLLLLRVSGCGRRGDDLDDSLGKYWRHSGSLQVIAGPDLATRTVEPHEFLDFVTGKLARRFIDSSHTLDLRVEQMDLRPDRDARFRVSEFFCHDDTWKLTLSRLAGDSHAVVTDLRDFSQSNSGCMHRIDELFNLVPLHRIVFVVDDRTDQHFLRATLQSAWRQRKQRSPNRTGGNEPVSLIQLGSQRRRQLRNLLYAVSAAASGTPDRQIA